MVKTTTASTDKELQQIIDLQRINLPTGLSQEEIISQGFVTVKHDFDLLKSMNSPFPHIIAKDEDQVIGYTLVMLASLRDRIPVLRPMFEKIDDISVDGTLLKNVPYFTMGQVCIDKNYRGQGIFDKLYEKMQAEMKSNFDFVITEVATRNKRSIRAHQRVGFQELLVYSSNEEEWSIIGWKLN